jgi:tetratricopeptide (TPR) repeat protein
MPSARLCLLAVAFALLACQSDSERVAEHQKRGDDFAKAEKWDEAVIEYRNALQIDPNNAPVHFGLAKAFLGKRDARAAYWELEETVRLDPNNVEARIQHGEFLLLGTKEDLEKAVQSGEVIVKADPKRWEGYALEGRALAGLGRHEQAGEQFQKAAELAGDAPAPLLLWANYLKTAGKTAEAEAAYKKLAAQLPGFTTSAALGGFYASQPGRDAEAEAAYRDGLAKAKPNEITFATTVVANFLASRGRLDDAETTLREAVAKNPESVDLIYVLAGFYQSRGRRDEATKMMEQATTAQPDKVEPWLVLSQYRGGQRDFDGALAAAEKAIQVAPDNVRAKLRRAEVLVDIGHASNDAKALAQAREAVDAILQTDEGHPEANFVKAKLDLAGGKTEDALADLRKTIDRNPNLPEAHFLMASAQLLSGDRIGARASASRALELRPNYREALGLLARVQAALGDHALAIEAGKRAIAQGADPEEMHIVIAQSLVQEGQLGPARDELEQIAPDKRGVDALFALGRIRLFQGVEASKRAREATGSAKDRADKEAAEAFADARRYLEEAAKLSPNNPEVLASLFPLDQRDGRVAEARARVATAIAAQPDNAALARLAGDMDVALGKADDAERSYRRAIALDANDLDAYGRLAALLGRVPGRSNEIVKTYEDALAKNPKSGQIQLILGLLKEGQGVASRNEKLIDEAIQHYEQAIQLNPDLAVAKNNLAYWLAERGSNLDRALDLAQEAKEMLPSTPEVADTLGWVFYKKKLPDVAVNYFREAVGAFPPGSPTLPLVRHHLALAEAGSGDPRSAAEEWEQALKEQAAIQPQGAPDPAWVAEARAGLSKLRTS